MIIGHLGAHVPWAQVENHLEAVLALGLAPEIAINGPGLDNLEPSMVDQVARTLAQAQLRPTVHAPFFDLNPGALDPLIRQVTHQRLATTLTFAGQLGARIMIIHPGVDKWRYPNLDQTWLALAREFFPPLLEQAKKCQCRLAIENIYEETPDTLVQLVAEVDSQWFGHCFDIGHWNLFGKRPMSEWLQTISSRLFHLHLHDNHGLADDHLPVGDGSIDFEPLREHLKNRPKLPSITLEAHNPEHLRRSLQQVRTLLAET